MAEALHDDDNLLMRYLDGRMDPAELAAFELRLRQEPTLKKKLESLMVAVEAIRQYGTTSQVKTIHAQEMPGLRPGKAKVLTMSRFIRYAMAAAASVILLFIAIRFLVPQPPSANRLYAEAFVPYDASALRGGGSTSPIEEAYRRNDYSGVTKIASGGAATSAKDSLLAGVSFLQTGNTSKALEFFRSLSAKRPQPHLADIQYYEAMSLLKAGYYEEAASRMQAIQADVSHPYHSQFSEEYVAKVKKLKK